MANVNISSPFLETPDEAVEIEECSYIKDFVWQSEYLTKDTYINLVALASINSMTFVPTVLLNALVIYTTATRQRLRRHNTNIFLACLAGTDLITGLVSQPMAVAVAINRILGVEFCPLEKAQAVASTVGFLLSFEHLVLIGIDRYIAIKKPLRYPEIVTEHRIVTAVTLSWALALCFLIQETVLASIDSKTKIYSVYYTVSGILFSIIGVLFFFAILFFYGYILSETRRQIKRIRTEQLPQEELKRIKKNNSAANTFVIIVAAVVLTYLPAAIHIGVVSFSHSTVSPVKPRVMSILWGWLNTSFMLSSFINPFIYCLRMKKLRRSFLEILHLRQPENTPPAIEMQVVHQHNLRKIHPAEPTSLAVVGQ